MDPSDALAVSPAEPLSRLKPGRAVHRQTAATPLLVLDTNVVLDWLHFADPSCGALGRAIRTRQARWIATAAMRQELRHVLLRGLPGRRAVDAHAVLRGWDRWVTDTDAAGMDASTDHGSICHPDWHSVLRCQDADDQKFIDLALRFNASALLSRDRALLRLARRAAVHGLRILAAADWRPEPRV
jgi:predicted nucleic acid-binding protein